METIIVIEDDDIIRKQVSESLSYEGYNVITAEDGEKGIEKIKNNIPDLIICDIMMPGKNGYEVLEEVQKDPRTVLIPFIFLTAAAEAINIRTGMNLGADDYIIKPLKLDDLLNSIKVRLSKSKVMSEKISDSLSKIRQSVITSLPHEFRTPLNGVLGFSQILIDSYNDLEYDDVSSMLKIINDSGKKLLRLVVNFTYYSNLQSLTYMKNFSSSDFNFDPEPIILDTCQSVADHHERMNDLSITMDTKSIPGISEEYLSKIIEELCDNAFKFSVQGSKVTVKAFETEHNLILSFSSNGIIMTKDQLETIGAFIQFDRQKYEQQGVGMGLAIVKKILEIVKGEIEIESSQEHGTMVIVKIPFHKPIKRSILEKENILNIAQLDHQLIENK
jgi:CheY-like chemotaxis protein